MPCACEPLLVLALHGRRTRPGTRIHVILLYEYFIYNKVIPTQHPAPSSFLLSAYFHMISYIWHHLIYTPPVYTYVVCVALQPTAAYWLPCWTPIFLLTNAHLRAAPKKHFRWCSTQPAQHGSSTTGKMRGLGIWANMIGTLQSSVPPLAFVVINTIRSG